MTDRMDAVNRWPDTALQFIPAKALKDQAQRIGKWVALRALMQRGDGDIWENLILEGGISTEDFAQFLADEAGIARGQVSEFAREAIGKMRRR